MYTLGINYLAESSVCLLKNDRLIYAISEERFNRKKNWYGLPWESINRTLKDNKLKISDISYFATHGLSVLKKNVPDNDYFDKKIFLIKQSKNNLNKKKYLIKMINQRRKHEKIVINVRTKNVITKLSSKFKNLKIYDHHTCHAATAYYYSEFKNCYTLTIDGWGDNSSSKLFDCKNGFIKEIKSTPTIDSLGYFYGSITKLLGFTPHKHEGKILGLAAYSNPKKAYSDISKLISYNKITKNFEGNIEKGFYLPSFKNKLLTFLKKKYKPSEIAAATQKRLEDVVLEYVNDISKKPFNLAVAGGVFSNVKLNQKLCENKKIKNIYVFPNMGDGGLAVGAASLCANKYKQYKKFFAKDMYLGPEKNYEINRKNLKKFNIKKIQTLNPINEVANLLSKEKIIALYNGRMEFGPRSLCNRSIICSAKKVKINQTLNKKLKRTEFMPFAPVILKKYFNKYFYQIDKKFNTSKYMTMTFKCKKITSQIAPAVVHVDNTARPQVVDKKINKTMNLILERYYKITKSPILVNTSLNVHEEPIVCSVNDALRAFKSSNLDYILIGNNLFTHNVE